MMVVFRFVILLCMFITFAVFTLCDKRFSEDGGCQAEVTSVRIEVSTLMIHAICRDNSSVMLVLSCEDDDWYYNVQGFCNSFDLNIGHISMHRPLSSTSITLRLVKSGRTLDAARVVVITSQHLLKYRISVWGHQSTRFVLTVRKTCRTPHQQVRGNKVSGPLSKDSRVRSGYIPLISTLSSPLDYKSRLRLKQTNPAISSEENRLIPEYPRPNKLDSRFSETRTSLKHRAVAQTKKLPEYREGSKLSYTDSDQGKRFVGIDLKKNVHVQFRDLYDTKDSETTTQASLELAKLQWMENKRVRFEKKTKFMRNYYPETATSKYEALQARKAEREHSLENKQSPFAPVLSYSQPFVDRERKTYRDEKIVKSRRYRNSDVSTDVVQPYNMSLTITETDKSVTPPVSELRSTDSSEVSQKSTKSDRDNLSIVDFSFPRAGSFKLAPNSTLTPPMTDSTLELSQPSGGLPLFLPLALESSTPSDSTTLAGQTLELSLAFFSQDLLSLIQDIEMTKSVISPTSSILYEKTKTLENTFKLTTAIYRFEGASVTPSSVLPVLPTPAEKPSLPTSSSNTISVPNLGTVSSSLPVLVHRTDHARPVTTMAWLRGHTEISTAPSGLSSIQSMTVTLLPSVSSSFSGADVHTVVPVTGITPDNVFDMTSRSSVNAGISDTSRIIPLETSSTLLMTSTIAQPMPTSSSTRETTTLSAVKTPSLTGFRKDGVVMQTSTSSTRPLQTSATARSLEIKPTGEKTTQQIRATQTKDQSFMTSQIVFNTVTPQADEDNEGINEDSFWPVVAALVIGIPAIIVFGIAITVIHRRRLAKPAQLSRLDVTTVALHPSPSL